MTPKYVVYECEECGKLFCREVANVITDDAEHCDVEVRLINDANGELEEFPMCDCIGGTFVSIDDIDPSRDHTQEEEIAE